MTTELNTGEGSAVVVEADFLLSLEEPSFEDWSLLKPTISNTRTAYSEALIGGSMIGASALSYLACNGRIAGLSGIFGGFSRKPFAMLLHHPAQASFLSAFCLTAYGLSRYPTTMKLFIDDQNDKTKKLYRLGSRYDNLPSSMLHLRHYKPASYDPSVLLSAGFLVGLGTSIGSGCTSGHGVCGLARLSGRSLAAVSTFMLSGMATSMLASNICPQWYRIYDFELSPYDREKYDEFESRLTNLTHNLSGILLPAGMAALLALSLHRGMFPAKGSDRFPAVLSGAFSGSLFSAGLVVSGMNDPEKVRSFLNPLSGLAVSEYSGKSRFIFGVTSSAHRSWNIGGWDPSLMLVMSGALCVTLMSFPSIVRRSSVSKPWFSDRWFIPTRTGIDRRLIGGSATFGCGWGLAGICPGPGIVLLCDPDHSDYLWIWFTGLIFGFHSSTFIL